MKLPRCVSILAFLASFPSLAPAQWNPGAGQWGRSSPNDLRVMTWNVKDAICSTNDKVAGPNNWSAVVRIVAAMKPDLLILQETADNSGNGTGSTVDSVSQLTTTIGLFLHGGNDPFKPGNPPVTSYVQLYAPGYDLPFVFVNGVTDGFNRNAILSRYPFADLNGDTHATLNDIPTLTPDLYAPGGNGGIRGYMTAEIDLPDALYAGDLVIGCSHLKAGSTSSDHDQRVHAGQNIAYFIDYWFNGAGQGIPDPHNRIADSPPATSILGPDTPVITGGDWNEDEVQNGATIGPADWIARAQVFDSAGGTDGTDRNRTDMTYDAATDVFTGSPITEGARKLDYLSRQDSVVAQRRAFLFDTATVTPASAMPPEVVGYSSTPGTASATASDHFPVIADFILPGPLGCNTAATDLGFAMLGGNSVFPRFFACGALSSGNQATLTLSSAAPLATAFAIVGPAPGLLNLLGGTIVPSPPALAGPFTTDASGTFTFTVPGGGGPFVLYAQWGILDAAAGAGFSLSNALKLDFLP